MPHNKIPTFKPLSPTDPSAAAWQTLIDREEKRHIKEMEDLRKKLTGDPYYGRVVSYAELAKDNNRLIDELSKRNGEQSKKEKMFGFGIRVLMVLILILGGKLTFDIIYVNYYL